MENFNLGITEMSVTPENPLFPNPVLPKTSVCGGNYFLSVRQFLEAEKKLRISTLVKHTKLNLKEIQSIFEPENESDSIEEDAKKLVSLIPMDEISSIFIQNVDSNSAIIYYLAGYCVKALLRSNNCESCKSVISMGKAINANVEQDITHSESASSSTAAEFLEVRPVTSSFFRFIKIRTRPKWL